MKILAEAIHYGVTPLINKTGEIIYPINNGSEKHSMAYVIVPPSASSIKHYHISGVEEMYYILSGEGVMVIDAKIYDVSTGDAILISPKETHQIFCKGYKKSLIFICTCSPKWTENNTIEV